MIHVRIRNTVAAQTKCEQLPGRISKDAKKAPGTESSTVPTALNQLTVAAPTESSQPTALISKIAELSIPRIARFRISAAALTELQQLSVVVTKDAECHANLSNTDAATTTSLQLTVRTKKDVALTHCTVAARITF